MAPALARLLVTALLGVAPPALAQTATVELVVGPVVTTGTISDRTFRFLKELDRLVPGTRIHLKENARAVLIQTRRSRSHPTDPRGATRFCVTWTIMGGVERYTIRDSRHGPSSACAVSRADVRLPGPNTPVPFVRSVTYEEVVHDRADLPEPRMLTQLRQAADALRAPIIGRTPERDVAVSHTIEGETPGPLAIAGTARNTSANFYPCVLLRFALLDRLPGDRYVRAGTASVVVRRLRAHESRSYRDALTGGEAITLESVRVCE